MNKQALTEIIISKMEEACLANDSQLIEDINDETQLMETGLDSLGFAVVVVMLEEELGFDPFAESDEIIYPENFSQFLHIYYDHLNEK